MIRSVVCLFVFCSMAICRADTEIDKTKLADCQVHVVGQYMPEHSGTDFRVKVDVKGTGKPMVVVLCSYSETQWNVSTAKDADVRLILISGWYEQSIGKIPEGIPVKKIVGANGGNNDYFWAYSRYSAEGLKLQEKVKELLGKEIDTFQGAYGGTAFVIDGVKTQPDPQQAPSKTSSAEESSSKPWTAKVSQLVGDKVDRASVEKVVRKLFELETKEKEQRIKQAEADLEKVKQKFAKRLASAEEIIQSRIDAFRNESHSKSESEEPAESASELLASATELWNQQRYSSARKLLERVVALDPKNHEAWNKLGWTSLHTGDTEIAIKAFREAVTLNPDNLGASNGLGRALLAQGKLDEAEKELLQATEKIIAVAGEANTVKSKMTASWFGLVEVNIKQNDMSTAIEWAERYLKHEPDDKMMQNLLRKAKNSQ
jgi:Tfp pilus assembly protein PilF